MTSAAEANELTMFIAVGNNNGWGRGLTENEAVKNMKANGGRAPARFQWIVYHVHKETDVNEMGGFSRPFNTPAPIEVSRRGF